MKKIKILLIGISLITIIAIVLLLIQNSKKEANPLKINYENGNKIGISNIKDNYKQNKKITIENLSDKTILYSIKWTNVTNTFINQSNFLYKVKNNKTSYREIEIAQLPVTESPIFPQIRIKPHTTHIYTISIWYNDKSKITKETKSTFKGNLQIDKLK